MTHSLCKPWIGFLFLLAGACSASVSPYARATAGRIGCPASKIELDQLEQADRGPDSWVAFCGGTGYACSSHGDIQNPQSRIVCSELGRPVVDARRCERRAHQHHYH